MQERVQFHPLTLQKIHLLHFNWKHKSFLIVPLLLSKKFNQWGLTLFYYQEKKMLNKPIATEFYSSAQMAVRPFWGKKFWLTQSLLSPDVFPNESGANSQDLVSNWLFYIHHCISGLYVYVIKGYIAGRVEHTTNFYMYKDAKRVKRERRGVIL